MEPASKSAIRPEARRAVDLRFVELIDKVRRNRPGDDLELLRRAYDFAAEQHKTQTRLSGEPLPLASSGSGAPAGGHEARRDLPLRRAAARRGRRHENSARANL